jgi:hypothetical protein
MIGSDSTANRNRESVLCTTVPPIRAGGGFPHQFLLRSGDSAASFKGDSS